MSPLANLPTGAAAIFWGVLTFSILVVLHEGGHFLAARAFGVKVHEFMLGLPGPALRWRSKRSGVVYGITAIPLGGYVRIAGMEPGSEDELLGRALGLLVDRGRIDSTDLASELAIPKDRASALLATLEDYRAAEAIEGWPESRPVVQREAGEDDVALLARVRSSVYRGQASWKRIAILAMGVLVNLATAVLVFTVVLSAFGLPVPSDKPVVGSVQSGSAAAVAGLQPGDVVLNIEGATVARWGLLQEKIAAYRPGQTVHVGISRNAVPMSVSVTLGARTDTPTVAFLGVGPGEDHERLPVLAALKTSFGYIGLTFVAIADFFNPTKFAASVSNARSVVGISYEVARAAEAGPFEYAWLVAVLSLSLGVMNILPIPPLDGGKVAVEIVEALVRRPIPKKISYALSGIGAALLFSLIFYLMYADVMRYVVHGS